MRGDDDPKSDDRDAGSPDRKQLDGLQLPSRRQLYVLVLMAFNFGRKSLDILNEVHPDLAKVARRALELTPCDFCLIAGRRTVEKENAAIAAGKSQTHDSRHLYGMAIDVCAFVRGVVSWDVPWYNEINKAFQQAAMELNIPITWGGNWTTLKDYDHFELDRHYYPDPVTSTGVNET